MDFDILVDDYRGYSFFLFPEENTVWIKQRVLGKYPLFKFTYETLEEAKSTETINFLKQVVDEEEYYELEL